MDFTNSPEHWHVILNHIPILGLGFGLLPLVWGLIKKDNTSLRWGLIFVLMSSVLTPIIMETGESSEDRLPKIPGVLWDEPSKQQFEIHEERAETSAKFLYGLCGLSAIALTLSFFKKKAAFIFALLACILGIVSLALTAWTGEAGGKIRHPEFRSQNIFPSH